MRTPMVLLKYLAKALANVLPGGPLAVDFVVDVLPEACKDAWELWSKDRSADERKADVEAVAQAGAEQIKEEVAEKVLEFAADKPQEVQETISFLLSQVPSMVRKSLRRPSEPTGMTVAPDREPKEAKDLLSFLPPRPPRFKSGDHFGDWEIVKLLGVGGFGEVWKARNPHMPSRPPVALKFCLDSNAAKVLRNEAAVLDRVMREGKHPGIVELLHTYLNSDTPCLEYEFVDGGDLEEEIQAWHRYETAPKPEQIAEAVLQMADTVGFAHKLNPPIVHRDLKPANILAKRTSEGTTTFKIADFGVGGVAANQIRRESMLGTTQGRLVSAVRGSFTPLYASPQQMRGDQPDPRDDVYALGVIWYQMLTCDLNNGRPGGVKYKNRLTEMGMTPGMIELLGSCFEDEPEDRPDNAADLAQKIRMQFAAGNTRPTPIGGSTKSGEETTEPIPQGPDASEWSSVVTLNVNDHFNIWRTQSGWLTEEMCKGYAVILKCVELEGTPTFRFVPFDNSKGNGMKLTDDPHQRSQWREIQWREITGYASNKQKVQLQVRFRLEPQLVRG